jgi:protoheme IX farnesyltransferase
VLYSAILIPLSALPMVVGLGGFISVIGLLLGGFWMLYKSILFLKDNSDANARQVMFASFVYLPLVLITLVIDKYI